MYRNTKDLVPHILKVLYCFAFCRIHYTVKVRRLCFQNVIETTITRIRGNRQPQPLLPMIDRQSARNCPNFSGSNMRIATASII